MWAKTSREITHNMLINIFNWGLPDQRYKLWKWDPCIIAFRWNQIIDDERSHLRNCTKVAPSQRASILNQCLSIKWRDVEARGVETWKTLNEDILFIVFVFELVLDEIPPKILDKAKKDNMEYLNRSVLMWIKTFEVDFINGLTSWEI